MPKMHQNTFAGRAPPGPAGGAHALPQTPQWRSLLLSGGRTWEGPILPQGDEREERGNGKGWERNSRPK